MIRVSVVFCVSLFAQAAPPMSFEPVQPIPFERKTKVQYLYFLTHAKPYPEHQQKTANPTVRILWSAGLCKWPKDLRDVI